MTSPFLTLPQSAWVAYNTLAFAIRDGYPVSPGHTLVIPRREVATWFEATRDEQLALLDLVGEVKRQLDADFHPHGYNVGFNSGEAAGQTVMHLHVHVVPRYEGDMDDPRGGVRHVIPWKGNYKRALAPPLATGGATDPFIDHVGPLFAASREVAIVAAFVQDSGLELLEAPVTSAVARGGLVQVVTGDYLDITQAEALQRMLDWQGAPAEGHEQGRFEVRIVETAKLPGTSRSFHPKSWRFEGPGLGVAWVGSSNVSRSALQQGIEWNLRVDRWRDPGAFAKIREAFSRLWSSAVPLTPEWVAAYSERARRKVVAPLPAGEAEAEPLTRPPEAHPVQQQALEALALARAEGKRRALVVMATGLGKTLLAALDAAAVGIELGRPPRVLFLAHRKELLAQAAKALRLVLRTAQPTLRIGWYAEGRAELDAPVVVASVQTVGRPEHLARLAGEGFDYVVLDEAHHAEAATYRRILSRISAGFLLGLTATPDRADEGDIVGLFDDHVAFRADLGVGIQVGRLVPFDYFGLKDTVDYSFENIPWRNRRFDPAALERAVQTEQRMQVLWNGWREHPGTRSLVFCCSIPHADFVRRWLTARGLLVRLVHSGPGSDDRSAALSDLEAGRIDAVCAVDLFNEGVDVPHVDRVVMLRPTESPVLFLQQLGRGLRCADGKARLTVIDFVGNHRVFLDRVRTLLSLGGRGGALRELVEAGGRLELPTGCSMKVELEAVALLDKLLPRGASEVERVYRELHAARGERPRIGELFRMNLSPSTLRTAHGSWLDFVAGEGHLTEAEQAVHKSAGRWFSDLETAQMTKCFKMIVLQALIEEGALREGLPLDRLAARSHEILLRSPELLRDLEGVRELPDPRNPAPATWQAYWRKNPVAAWAGTAAKPGEWFRVEGDRFVPRLSIPEGLDATFEELTLELVDYRLAQYRRRLDQDQSTGAFTCRVFSNNQGPVLKLPDRDAQPGLPLGDVDARLPDGSIWRFRFVSIACNVAHPVGSDRNQLHDLLRSWFGPSAGKPGTAFQVRFTPSPDGLWVEPTGKVVELPPRGAVTAFPSLRAAAGPIGAEVASAPEAEQVFLPVKTRAADIFAVRAAGDSMNGGADPIRDGDWLIMKYARGAGLGAVEGRVALVETEGAVGDSGYQVKRVVKDGRRWFLDSDRPGAGRFEASERTRVVALLIDKISPEELAPAVGSRFSEDGLAAAFGLEAQPANGRVGGHLFLFVERSREFVAPDGLRRPVPDRRPGETAYVLTRETPEAQWRYAGVGRWHESSGEWTVPELDFATWRALGEGRGASRRLPDGVEEKAREVVAQVIERVGAGGWVEHGGKRCRVVGNATAGGARIDGGQGGFAERTVSLTDIAWVLAAERDVSESGGVLDEARVNRLRYLEGTPRGSTRWIDTGWAILLVEEWKRASKAVDRENDGAGDALNAADEERNAFRSKR
jgi:superfamily II DNA or RNA helicase/diadenosine tetraphosphate (Ap4A) HIT family hydrolase